MGSILGKQDPPGKSQATLDYEKKLAADKVAEDKRAADAKAAAAEQSDKKAKGLIGSRSMFGKSGGRGYFEGK